MPINTQPEDVGTVVMANGDIVNFSQNGPGGQLRSLSVQAAGTWASATLALQVSNDGAAFYQAKDTAGTDIKLTADGLMTCLTPEFAMTYKYMRVLLSGGGGTTDITITCFGSRG